MKLIDNLKSMIDADRRNEIADVLAALSDKARGGLNDVVTRLKDSELRDQVSSWISSNIDKVPSGEQIQKALNPEVVKDVAGRLGVSVQEASGTIAKALPGIIDKITPDGKLPDLSEVSDQIAALTKGRGRAIAVAGGVAVGVAAVAVGVAAAMKSSREKRAAAKPKTAAKPKAAAKPRAAAAKPKTTAAAKPKAATAAKPKPAAKPKAATATARPKAIAKPKAPPKPKA